LRLSSTGLPDVLSKDVQGGGPANVSLHLPFLYCGSQVLS